jgi:hypothetical protein
MKDDKVNPPGALETIAALFSTGAVFQLAQDARAAWAGDTRGWFWFLTSGVVLLLVFVAVTIHHWVRWIRS